MNFKLTLVKSPVFKQDKPTQLQLSLLPFEPKDSVIATPTWWIISSFSWKAHKLNDELKAPGV